MRNSRDSRVSTATHLQRRAASYRALARRTVSIGMARELYLMADDYEADAGRLAAAADTTMPPPLRLQTDRRLD